MRVFESGLDRAEEGTEGRLLAPAGPDDLAAHYDLTMCHPAVDMDLFASFDRWLAAAALEHGLSCALIHDGVVHEALRRVTQGRLRIGFHLDYFALWHLPDDPYARLALAVQDAGGRPINPPARARAFTDKAAAHGELARHGLGVPPTVVVRPWTPDGPLSERDRQLLRLDEPGACVYLKPANGFAARGVVRVERTDPQGLAEALAGARSFDRQDAFLVQREVRPPLLGCEDGRARPAYWRVLNCLGEWTAFWWQPLAGRLGSPGEARPCYRILTPAEMRRHRLQPVLQYARELADLTGLEWFSTELCLGDGPEVSRHTVTGPDGRPRPVLAIDYVNDQCDVDVQSRWPTGVPDLVVRRIAGRIAEAAWRVRQESLHPAAAVPWRGAA
jgi:hypothetical protein